MNFRDNERLQKYAGTYEQYICRCIDYFSKRNIKITLVSLCEDDGDTAAIERISQKYKDKSINRSYYNGHNWKSIIDEFQTSEYVIATRFHSMILGLEYGSKVLPIVYNQKTKYVLEDLGLEKWGISLPNLSESLISEDCFIEKPDVECVSAESEAQFKALDGLLMNHLNNL